MTISITKIFNLTEEKELEEYNKIANDKDVLFMVVDTKMADDCSKYLTVVSLTMTEDKYKKMNNDFDNTKWECPLCFKKFIGLPTIIVAGKARAFCPECSKADMPAGEFEMKVV